MFAILRDFRHLTEAVEQLVAVLGHLITIQRDAGPALDRLEALELSRHQFEAEVAGTLLKAEGKLKAASNAEARERQLKRSYERQLDEGFESIEETAEKGNPVLHVDAETREAERLQAMRLDVAPSNKEIALRAKWA